jgi:hypothetical protein
MARIAPPDARLVDLMYREGLKTSLLLRRVWRHVDFMCRCLVFVRAMIWGLGWLLRRSWRSRIVVCMPLVFRVSAVMDGCE